MQSIYYGFKFFLDMTLLKRLEMKSPLDSIWILFNKKTWRKITETWHLRPFRKPFSSYFFFIWHRSVKKLTSTLSVEYRCCSETTFGCSGGFYCISIVLLSYMTEIYPKCHSISSKSSRRHCQRLQVSFYFPKWVNIQLMMGILHGSTFKIKLSSTPAVRMTFIFFTWCAGNKAIFSFGLTKLAELIQEH